MKCLNKPRVELGLNINDLYLNEVRFVPQSDLQENEEHSESLMYGSVIDTGTAGMLQTRDILIWDNLPLPLCYQTIFHELEHFMCQAVPVDSVCLADFVERHLPLCIDAMENFTKLPKPCGVYGDLLSVYFVVIEDTETHYVDFQDLSIHIYKGIPVVYLYRLVALAFEHICGLTYVDWSNEENVCEFIGNYGIYIYEISCELRKRLCK